MIATSDNDNLSFFYLVDKPMLPVNPTRPAASKLKTEGFRFSCALKRGSPDLFKERQVPFGLTFISFEPIAQVVESSRSEREKRDASQLLKDHPTNASNVVKKTLDNSNI